MPIFLPYLVGYTAMKNRSALGPKCLRQTEQAAASPRALSRAWVIRGRRIEASMFQDEPARTKVVLIIC